MRVLNISHLLLLSAPSQAQEGQHDTIVANVHDLLAHLAYHFSTSQLDKLFSLFQKKCVVACRRRMKEKRRRKLRNARNREPD